MKNHELFSASNNNEDIAHNNEQFLGFGDEFLPEYTRDTWKDNCKTLETKRLQGLVDVLIAIKNGSKEYAIKTLENNWLSDGFVMKSVATCLSDGVDVVRQVYKDTWGEAFSQKNKDFLDRLDKWHEEQQKLLSKKDTYEDEHGPTTREKFMERVHDTFGPEEARMMAFAIRNANNIGKPARHPFGITYYDPYAASVSFIGETDEPKYVPSIMEWTEINYKNDLEDYKRNFIDWINSGSYTEKQTSWLKKAVNDIDACLEDDEEPSYRGKNFPTTMRVQGNIEDFKDNNDFMYCNDLTTAFNSYFGHKNNTYGETTARLYMCPRTDTMTKLIDEFRHKCARKDVRYSFKYSSDPYRNDRIVIYTNYNRINDHLDVLKEIKQEHPELFRDMDDTRKNPFWGKIDGAPEGVYFGEEPPEEINTDKQGKTEHRPWTSYSSLRAEIFEKADQRWAKEVYGDDDDDEDNTNPFAGIFDGWGLPDNAKHFNSPSDISWESARRLEQIFREELSEALPVDVDPNNICFNKSNQPVYSIG